MRAAMMRLGDRLVPAFWNAVAGALPRLALLLAGLYVAHRFGPDEYARYSLAFATFALLGTLPGMTLTTVVSKFVPRFGGSAERRVELTTVVRFTTVLAGAIGLAALLLAPGLSRVFGIDPPITGLLLAAAAGSATAILAGGAVGLLMGAARFAASAVAYAIGFAAFAVGIGPLSLMLGSSGVLVAIALLYLAAAAAAFRWSTRSLASATPARHDFRSVWDFYLPMLVAAGLVTPVMWLVNTLLSHGGSALEDLSRFNAAYSWFAVLSFAPAVLAQVEFVALVRERANRDAGALERKLLRFVGQNALVMLPLAGGAAALAPLLVGVYGLEGAAAESTLRWMAAAAFAASLGNPAGLFLSATDRAWIASALNAGWGIATLALCWMLRARGAEGAAFGFFVAYCAHFVFALLVAHRLLATPRTASR